MLAGDATVPGLTAAVLADTAPPAGPDRHRPAASRTPGSASRSTTTARSRASTTSAPAARRSPAAATRSGPMSTSRATGTPGTSTRAIRARARRSPPPRSRSPSAARTAPRSGSSAASATARSSSTCGSGPTRPGSSSRPTSTGTTAGSCSRRASRSRSAPTTPPSNARTASSAAPTHRNTSWDTARFEVVAHRFADLSEHGYGVALLNDGKYGHHAFGNELGLSLLRSPVYPDPFADEGRQSFTYALFPHAGDWLTGGVLAEAEDLNQPLLCRPVTAGRPGQLERRGRHWPHPRPQRLQVRRGRRRPDPARLRAGRRARQRRHHPARRLAARRGGQPARGRGRTGGHQLPAVRASGAGRSRRR